MTRRSDTGSATVHAAILMAVLCVVALVLVQVATLVRLRHEVAAAADLAALSASQASVAGADGCAAATRIASRNGAEIVHCTMDFDVATVTARATSTRWWGRWWVAEQKARAAPSSYLGR